MGLNAQGFENRYNESTFVDYTETNDILFSTAVPQPEPGGGFYEWITGLPLNVDEWDTEPVDLYMDIFEPMGDTLSQRPLVVICFGGGFLAGSREHWSIRLLAQELARRGYVTAAIDYRLGMNMFDADLANRAVYRGIQDGRSAIRYFKNDAATSNTYKIDTSRIFIGGHSSGAFIALHNLYLDKESERPASTGPWMQDGNVVADQGCLGCVGDNQGHDGSALACFGLAGALGFTSFIETSNDPSSALFHSSDDGTVPYDEGYPFSNYTGLVIGDDLPKVYGSLSIEQRIDTTATPYTFHKYTSRGHGVHEDGNSDLYTDIIPGINDWFFPRYLQPDSTSLSGEVIVCDGELIQDYQVAIGDALYWDWQVVGGSLINTTVFDNIATVQWDLSSPTHTISAIPYNEIDARGDTLSLTVDTYLSKTNTYISNSSSDWHVSSIWDGDIPLPCDTVIVPSQTSPIDILLKPVAPVLIKKMELGTNVNLMVKTPAILEIKD